MITVAKGLGGGFPIGAVIAIGDAASLLGPGSHGTTFGGNPPACAAGLAVLHVIERDGLLERAAMLGRHLKEALGAAHRSVETVRGEGLLLGIQLDAEIAPAVAKHALDAGFIVNPVAPSTIRLAPPLILTPGQADEFVSVLPGLIDQAQAAV